MPKIEKTYMLATVLMTGDERVPVKIGPADRIKAKQILGKTNVEATETGDIDEWMAYCTYSAWKRTTGSGVEFQEWLDRYEGSEFETDEDEESEGESSPAE